MMPTLQTTMLLLILAFTAACSSTAPTMSMTPSSPYRLGPGDEVRIIVFGLPALSNDYIVGDSGLISIPLLEPTNAMGKQLDQLEAEVKSALLAKQLVNSPSVSVQVQRYRPFFIIGEVQRPGQYPYVPGMSVITAVSIAGGYTYRADISQPWITRTTDQKTVRARARQETPVMPDDTIQIPEGWF